MIYRNNCQLLQQCNVYKYKNQNSYHVIDVVANISLVPVVFNKLNVIIMAKLAILQRFVAVKQKRYQRKPQEVKPHILYHQTHLLLMKLQPSPPVSPQQPCSNVYDLFPVKGKTNPIVLTVCVKKAVLPMELDAGASLSLISKDTYKSVSSVNDKLKPIDVSLLTYTGETLAVLGYVDVQVEYESQALILPLIVVKGHGPSLLCPNVIVLSTVSACHSRIYYVPCWKCNILCPN